MRAYVTSQISFVDGQDDQCPRQPGTFIQVGTFDSSVEDGQKQSDVPVSVYCTVIPSGDKFQVDVKATLRSSQNGGGTVEVSGTLSSSGTQTNVKGSFQSSYGTFSQSDCTVSYDLRPTSMGIAAGRVWAFIDCKNATETTGALRNNKPEACSYSAEFRFENCLQSPATK